VGQKGNRQIDLVLAKRAKTKEKRQKRKRERIVEVVKDGWEKGRRRIVKKVQREKVLPSDASLWGGSVLRKNDQAVGRKEIQRFRGRKQRKKKGESGWQKKLGKMDGGHRISKFRPRG